MAAESPPSRRSSPDLHARIDDLEALVGAPPSRALGREGSGLLASVERLHAELADTREAVTACGLRTGALEGSVSKLAAAVDGLVVDVRGLTAEIRRGGSGRPPPPTRRRLAQAAGAAALITALSTGIAVVVQAVRGERAAQAAGQP